jgi:hypothetical protein
MPGQPRFVLVILDCKRFCIGASFEDLINRPIKIPSPSRGIAFLKIPLKFSLNAQKLIDKEDKPTSRK